MNKYYPEFSSLFVSCSISHLLLFDNILIIFKNCNKIIYNVYKHPLSLLFFNNFFKFLLNVSDQKLKDNYQTMKVRKIEILRVEFKADINISKVQALSNEIASKWNFNYQNNGEEYNLCFSI